MTFEELSDLWAKRGVPGVVELCASPLLIPIEPWARVRGVQRTQFSTAGPPPELPSGGGATSSDATTDAALPVLRLVHTKLGDRYPATEIGVQLVRKTGRNVYAHVAVGRSVNNDIMLDQPSVSRFQADLRLIEGSYRVRDAKSRNGTRLNGELVSAAHGEPVCSGDVVTFGEASCVFCLITEASLTQVLGRSRA